MHPLRSGQFRQKVTLQQLQTPETFDTFGQAVKTWTSLGPFWAEIRPLKGNEAYVARQVKAEATHAITLRYLGSSVKVDPTDRLVFNSRVFGIVEIRNVEERNWQYELVCKEIQVNTTQV